MMFLSSKQLTPKRRRILFIGAGISLVLIAIGSYGVYSATTWNAYKVSYESWHTELKGSVASAMKQPAGTSTERAKKRVAFADISAKIADAQQSLCKITGVVSWQHFIGELREREEACTRIIEQTGVFGSKLDDVVAYLQHEQKLATILKTAITDSSTRTTEETWESQVAIWNTAQKAINGISDADDSFKPVKTSATDKIQTIESAWAELIAAHTAKDKSKYTDAQAKLTNAYEALPSMVNISSQHFIPLAKSLEVSYEKLLNPTKV